MKKYLILMLLVVLFTNACKKDFLDLEDPTRISAEDLYKDANGLNLAVNAAYGSLQDIYGKGSGGVGMYLFGEVPSDNSTAIVSGAGLSDLEFFITAPENANLSTMWTNLYRGIARCNAIIDRSPAIDMSTALKERYVAEVKFLRALMYFNAVRIWGGVPLVTKELKTVDESLIYGRETQANVYAQIEKDLTDAEAVLPVSYTVATDLGRATRGAAKAVLGKVYLTQGKFDLCKGKLAELLPQATNPYGYDLLTNYADVYSITGELNKEVIFAVRYSKSGLGTGSPFFNWFLPEATGSTIAKVGGASGYNTVRQDLFDAFPTTDLRRDLSIGKYVGTTTVLYTKKYMDNPSNGFDADNDWIVIRYADVMLMYAEAENELNGPANAVSYINDIRRRAYGVANNLTAAQTANQATMRLAIETERRLELNMEGHRWFDLVRTKRAVEVMNAHFTKYAIKNGTNTVQISDRNTLFPIPLREIQINPKIIQNP
jgi:hypothetical protein